MDATPPPRQDAQPEPAPAEAPARRLPWGLLVLGLGLAAMLQRLHRLDLASFIFDEPMFLLAAREHLDAGTWPDRSPVGNSSGYPYGPSPIWFYRVVQGLLGSNAVVCIGVMCTVVLVCQLAFSFVLARRYTQDGQGTWRSFFRDDQARLGLGLVLLTLASAPAQWFWSRLAWDLFTFFTPFAVLALATVERPSLWRALAMGLLFGLAFSAHPMISALVVLVGLSVLWSYRGAWLRGLVAVALMALAFAAANLPWALYLLREPPAKLFGTQPKWDWAWWRWAEPIIPASAYRTSYWFEGDWDAFRAFAPGLLTEGWAQAVAAAVLAVGAVLGWALLTRSPRKELRRLAWVALASGIGYPLFFTLRRTLQHPHYQFPMAWWGVGGVAVLLLAAVHVKAGGWRPWAVRGVATAAFLAVAFNFGFLFSWKGYLDAAGGTRGVRVGTVVGSQRAALAEACRAGPSVLLANQTAVFEQALRQHASSLPDCQGKQVLVCQGGCPPPPPGAVVFGLVYAAPTGGRVKLQPFVVP